MEQKPQVKVWQLQGFEGLEANRSDGVTLPFQKQYLEHYLFAVGLGGVSEVTYRGEKTILSRVPQQGIFQQHQPGETLAARPLNGQSFTYRFVRISSTQLQTLLGADGAFPYFPKLLTDDTRLNGALAARFLSLFRALEGDASRLERESLLLDLLSAVIRNCADNPPPQRRAGKEHRAVALTKDFLSEHFGEDITLDKLAALAGFSKSYLLEVFKRHVGISPHNYLTCVRVDHTKRLLCQGLPISQVAYDAGFVDQSHLNRLFKKYVFVTPGRYRSDNLRFKQHPWHLDSRGAGE
jgi:AraC-like DNA-binding protein